MAALYTGYVLALFSIIPAMLWLAWYAWHRGHTPVFKILTGLCLTVALFAPVYPLIMLDPEHPFLWARIRFIAVAFVPVLFLLFVIAYVGYEKWLQPWRVMPLFIIPVITQAVIWLQPDWFFRSWQVVQIEGFNIEEVVYTGWFHIHSLFVTISFLVAIYLAVRFIQQTEALYRMQGILICAAGLVPFILGLMTTLHITSRRLPPLTPLGVPISLIIAGYALFRYRLLEVMPVAYETIVRNMNDAVIVLDNHQQIVSLNPAAEKLLNLVLETAIGQPIFELVPSARGITERYQARTGEAFEVPGQNGTFFDLRVSILQSAARRPVGWVAVLRDVTARKHAEQEREQLIRDLEAYSRTVAHDLKNPLSIIKGYAEIMMLSDELKPEEYRNFATDIHESSEKMREIMDSLLLLAQVRSQNDIPCARIDMGTVVQNVLNSLKSQIDRTNAVIRVPDVLPAAVGYQPWIELVWANYISNALKYGGKPPVIDILTEEHGGTVRYHVRDNGGGLTTEQQATVFEPFIRFHNQAEGHGIGLSIVRRIMEKLGGDAGVESQTGGSSGSKFYFTLPAV